MKLTMFTLNKIFLLTTILFVCSCSNKKEEDKNAKKNQAPPNVDIVIASTQALSHIIEANGSVVANESVEIHPEVSGRLTMLNVPDGGRVGQGTVLAKINDTDLKAQLSKSQVQRELAIKTQMRLKKLMDVNGINQADYDVALNNVNNVNADIEIIQAQLNKTIVKAPFSGVLGLRMISPGAFVTPATILATLQQSDKVKIDFSLPDIYTAYIKKGNTVNVMTNQGTEKRQATIVAIEPETNTATRNIKVRAMLQGAPLAPGTFVKVMVDAGERNDKMMMPTNAIIPDADSKKMVVVKNGRGVFTKVETGTRTSIGVEILNGIEVGDSVIVTGVLFVKPNSAVKIRKVLSLEEISKNQ